MGTVVRRVVSDPQPTHTFCLTTETMTHGRIINAEIRQPKSEKGTPQPSSSCLEYLPLVSITLIFFYRWLVFRTAAV